MTTRVHIIQGRSIDGTCWLQGINAWSDAFGFAHRFRTREQAELIAQAMILINRDIELDSMVGRICVIEVDEAELIADMNLILAQEASWEQELEEE